MALFARSDDEYLERLIDAALIKVCHGEEFEKLWKEMHADGILLCIVPLPVALVRNLLERIPDHVANAAFYESP